MSEKMDCKIVKNKQVIFKAYIRRTPTEADMEFRSGTSMNLEAPKESAAVLLKNLYLSCDPYMRNRMRDFHGSYLPPFVPGSVVEGFGVSRVVISHDPRLKRGDVVCGFTGWEEYTLVQSDKAHQLRKVDDDADIPLSYHIGLLGMPGFTAYVGFYEVCAPEKNEHVFVSAASGAVGQLVGQFAKLHGCYVVGSAGSSQKVNLLKKEFGYDEAFNYKEEPDLDAALKRYFPQGIDVYFENVGGAMLEAVLLNMRDHGRIAVCGMVSQNGTYDPQGIKNLSCLVKKRIRMQGFLQSDFSHLYPRFLEEVSSLYRQGKITYLEDMSDGLESGPSAFAGLFSGKNVGKQVICVAPE